MIVTYVDCGGNVIIIVGCMLLVSSGVVLCSKIGVAEVAVLKGRSERAVATLSVAPSLS